MPNVPTLTEVLDREFLELRAELLQAAARLDRIDRAEGNAADDPRMINLRKAISLLVSDGHERAERIQLVFSREYRPDWKNAIGLAAPANG